MDTCKTAIWQGKEIYTYEWTLERIRKYLEEHSDIDLSGRHNAKWDDIKCAEQIIIGAMEKAVKVKDIHAECQWCENLQISLFYMNGDHTYGCRKKPCKFITKTMHCEPCDQFTLI